MKDKYIFYKDQDSEILFYNNTQLNAMICILLTSHHFTKRRCCGIFVCSCIDFTTISTIFQLDVGTLLMALYFVLVSFSMLSSSWNVIMVQYSYSFRCRFVLILKTNLCDRSTRDIQPWDKGRRAMSVIKYLMCFCLY